MAQTPGVAKGRNMNGQRMYKTVSDYQSSQSLFFTHNYKEKVWQFITIFI